MHSQGSGVRKCIHVDAQSVEHEQNTCAGLLALVCGLLLHLSDVTSRLHVDVTEQRWCVHVPFRLVLKV